MTVPYTFATATSAIPLSQLDSNFATAITIGNTAVYLGNTTTSFGNVTLTNVTISSVASTFPNSYLSNSTATLGNATITLGGTTTSVGNLTLTNANIASGTVTITDITASGNVTLSGGTANGIAYLNGSKVLTTGSALTFDGSTLKAQKDTNSTINTLLTLRNDGTGFSGVGISFQQFSGTNGYIQNAYTGSGWATDIYGYDIIRFLNGSSPSEQMRLTSTGLGIGTSSPAYKLDVVGSIQSQGTHGAGSFNAFIIKNTLNSAASGKIVWQGSSGNETWAVAQNQTVGAGYLEFNYLGSNKAVLDPSGNLGLGVTPSAWGSIWKANQVGATGAIASSGSGNTVADMVSGCYNNNTNWIYQYSGLGAARYEMTGANAGSTHAWYNSAGGTAGNAITFTQAMTLDASGNLLVGTTSGITSGGVVIQPVSGQSTVYIGHITGTGSGASYSEFYYAGTKIGSITQSGTTAVLYNVTSDQRLKENIADAAPASDLIDALQVRQFDWKADGNHQRYGFVAQELVTVAPEAVHQPVDTEEMMAVDYSKLVPMLVKEIQSLRKRLADAGIA